MLQASFILLNCSQNHNGFFFFQEARKNISESLCPLEIVNTLIQNSHESRWPPGIRSEEAREANRDQLTAYRYRFLYKKFKSDQLGNGIEVSDSIGIIMAVDNTHMDEDMVINPGFLVLIPNFKLLLE